MIPWLDPDKSPQFPDTSLALQEPNGLLAVGGQLSLEWLLCAYRQGIFPWFSANEPIMWWTPAPRTILRPGDFHISKSLKKLIRQERYKITQNQAFEAVINRCAETRKNEGGSWIIQPMIEAYISAHIAGFAQSFECWDTDGQLVGGLYGISLNRMFFGESMFSHVSNASKLCLHHLIKTNQYDLIDCQMATSHLMSLGAIEIERQQFESMLAQMI